MNKFIIYIIISLLTLTIKGPVLRLYQDLMKVIPISIFLCRYILEYILVLFFSVVALANDFTFTRSQECEHLKKGGCPKHKKKPATSPFLLRYFSTSVKGEKGDTSINIISIPSKVKSKPSKIWIDFTVFLNNDFKQFVREIFFSNKLELRTDYSLIIKIKKNDIFFTIAKKQKHFSFYSIDDYSFERTFEFIQDKIYKSLEEYKAELEYSFDSVLLEFRPIKVDEKFKMSNLNYIKREYPNFDTPQFLKNLDYFGSFFDEIKGSPLNLSIINGKLQIFNTFDIKNLDRFLEVYNGMINMEDYFVKDSTKFFLIYRMNKPYIITVNFLDDGNIVKRCFNIHGDLIIKVRDLINKDGTVTRISGNSTITMSHQAQGKNILYMCRDIKLTPIKEDYLSTRDNRKDWLPNINIGVLDLETYENDGIGKCYALGFYCREVEKPVTFYINKYLDSTELIHECINEILKPKYNKNIFYVHNLGKFDAPFIIKGLINFNNTDKGKDNPYILDIVTRNSDILSLTIKRRINDRIQSVKLKDSIPIINRDLRSLCKDFEVEIEKGYFPYNFCNKDTLFYVGKTPNVNYYNNISLENYKLLYKEVWSLKQECLLYLEKDLISLYQIISKVNKTLHFLLKMQMIESLTISGISMKYFLRDHYDSNKRPIPLVTNRIIWNDIYKAYCGARTEVLNPYFKNNNECPKLYYYDVNSLYPFASLNPMPGINCQYLESFGQPLELEKLFGFFYCKINSNGSDYLGLLPKRSESGHLLFPKGEWYDWYFTEELKFVKENGYKIEPIKGYNFNSVQDVFTSFVTEIMKIKINSKNISERNVAKLILNSLIGRFGMDFLKSITELHDRKTHDLISVTRALSNSIEINDDLYLDTFKPGIDKEVCEDFGVDYIKALNSESVDEKSTTRRFKSVSIPIAAATLSYARIHMTKLMKYILDRGGKIYYTDTDSIVTDLKLSEDLVHLSELGKLKLEHEIVEAYFIADKTYAFITVDGKLVKRAKGINSYFLTLDDYKNMYNMKGITNGTKTASKRDYAKGSVVITNKKNIKLNFEQYTKREKIFKGNKWIGTKPIQVRSYSSMREILTKPLTSSYTVITKKDKKRIKEIIDSVKGTDLFQIAFTHRSCCSNNTSIKSYETLEFFGDSLLYYYVAKILYTTFLNHNEGEMTQLRALLVGTKNLGELSKKIGLNQYLSINNTLSKEKQINILNKEKTLADIFESFIAMLYLEKGEDILLKFLWLTIFNISIIKEKKDEFNKLNISKSGILPYTKGDKSMQSSDPLQITEKKILNNDELFKENSSAERDIVIPLDKNIMNQITFKFEDLKPKNLYIDEKQLKTLLDKNHQIIIKEFLKLQTITHNDIININNKINNYYLTNKTNFKNESLRLENNINQLRNIEFKEMFLQNKNSLKEIVNIKNSIACAEKSNLSILELYQRLNRMQYILYLLIVILLIIILLIL